MNKKRECTITRKQYCQSELKYTTGFKLSISQFKEFVKNEEETSNPGDATM